MAKSMTLIKKAKKAPRKSKIQQNIIDKKSMGEEPTVNENSTNIEMILAFNWYNYMTSRKDVIKWLLEYVSEDEASHISKLKESYINKTCCYIARLILNENKVPDYCKESLQNHIGHLMSTEVIKVDTTKVEVVKAYKETKGDLAIAEIDEAYDKLDSEFSTYNYLSQNDVPKVYCASIESYYTPLLAELDAVLIGKDKELKEGYACYSKPQLKKMKKYIEDILSDVSRYSDNKKTARKPRKPKKISSETILKHLKYCKEDTENQIVSIDPERILNASELFTYNVKYKVLTKFVAKKGEKLKVHRSAITNFDEKQSKSKRVGRKGKAVIETILNGSMTDRRKVFEQVNTDFIKIPDRCNDNVVLLWTKVFK
jgi:RecG-like helicase